MRGLRIAPDLFRSADCRTAREADVIWICPGVGPEPSVEASHGEPVLVAEIGGSEHDAALSDDSADEDFAQMRRHMKTSSMEIASTQDLTESNGGKSPTKTVFAPPPRAAPASVPKAVGPKVAVKRPSGQKFVKLELMESSGEDEDEEENDENSSGSAQEEGEEHVDSDDERDAASVRALSRLLRKAPDGECNWDVWLETLHQWPRLQIALGSPDFFRRGDDLRVAFGAERLRVVLEEQRRARAERQQKRAEAAERLVSGVAEFIKETERRRELMGGRLGGGFVLNPSSPELEEARNQRRHREEDNRTNEQQHEKEQKQQQQRQKQQQEQQQQQPPAPGRPKKDQEAARKKAAQEDARRRQEEIRLRKELEAAQAQEKLRIETEAHELEARLERVFAEVQGHRCALCDRHISLGPPLSGLSMWSNAILSEDAGEGSSGSGILHEACVVFLLPWGPQDSACTSAGLMSSSAEQREALTLIHEHGLAEGLLLVPAKTLASSGAPDIVCAYTAAVLLLVRGTVADTMGMRLPCGYPLSEVLIGPLPSLSLASLLKKPLALWGHDERASDTLCGGQDTSSAPEVLGCSPGGETESVCIAMYERRGDMGEGALRAILEELEDEGLTLVGMRLAFPEPKSEHAVVSTAFRAVVRAGHPVLLLAVRGPHALSIWRTLLGPSDPQLARRTDPASLNARFGGQGRDEVAALAPSSSIARAQADMAWAFGGRIDAKSPALPKDAVHAVVLAAPRTYALALVGGPVTFAAVGSLLGGLLLRAGRIVSLEADSQGEKITVAAVREGGGAFVKNCGRLLMPPPTDIFGSEMAGVRSPSWSSPTANEHAVVGNSGTSLVGLESTLCEIPPYCGLVMSYTPLPEVGMAEEACRLGEPEVLVIGLRPRGAAAVPLLLQSVCNGLFTKFGPFGPDGCPSPPGLAIGGAVDLLAVRNFDFGALVSVAGLLTDVTGSSSGRGDMQKALTACLEALRGFRNFEQVVRRAPDDSCIGWWEASEAGGPTTLLCFRGEGLIGRFKAFLAREWKLPAVIAGDVFFSPSLHVARQAYHCFFSSIKQPFFSPSVPQEDLRSMLRFQAQVPELKLAEDMLFARSLSPQLTVAVLMPPTLDTVLFRLLTSAEQQGFRLVAAVMAGGLPKSMAQPLFEQEVADGHLKAGDWESFCESVGCHISSGKQGEELEEEDDEDHFKCVWLVLSRHQAVKRLAQLCGHGDPAVNQQHLHASLRLGPFESSSPSLNLLPAHSASSFFPPL